MRVPVVYRCILRGVSPGYLVSAGVAPVAGLGPSSWLAGIRAPHTTPQTAMVPHVKSAKLGVMYVGMGAGRGEGRPRRLGEWRRAARARGQSSAAGPPAAPPGPGLGGCGGSGETGDIGWNPALLPAGMSRDAFDGCADPAQPDISCHGLLWTRVHCRQ